MNETIRGLETLNAIQTELNAPKSRKSSGGASFKYRSAEDILQAVKPLLNEYGAALLLKDNVIMRGERFYIKATATLLTTDGGKFKTVAYAREDETRKGISDPAQITGGSSSYARKGALSGLLALDDNQDPDSIYQPTETEIDEFIDLVETGNGTALFFLNQNNQDKYLALSKAAAPEGGKTKFKQRMRDLIADAVNQAKDYADQISARLMQDDAPGLKELVDELEDDEKALVWRQLTPEQKRAVKTLLQGE